MAVLLRPAPRMQPTITSAPRPALPTAGKLLAKQAEAIRLRTAMMQVEAVVKMLQSGFNIASITVIQTVISRTASAEQYGGCLSY